MSFPNLVLGGSVTGNNAYINSIGVSYDGTYSVTKPAKLTRTRYDVRRATTIINVHSGTPSRYNDVPYDAVRRIHTWTGYLDVLTASVGEYSLSSTQVKLNLDLIAYALIFQNTGKTGVNGIEYTLPLPDSLGPADPSSSSTYETGSDSGSTWVYEIKSTGGATPVYTLAETTCWLIKDINIIDNGNNTSRVTFTFEIVEKWKRIGDAINALP